MRAAVSRPTFDDEHGCIVVRSHDRVRLELGVLRHELPERASLTGPPAGAPIVEDDHRTIADQGSAEPKRRARGRIDVAIDEDHRGAVDPEFPSERRTERLLEPPGHERGAIPVDAVPRQVVADDVLAGAVPTPTEGTSVLRIRARGKPLE